MKTAPECLIVARRNGVGLDRDVEILRAGLAAAGIEASFEHCRRRNGFSWVLDFILRRKPFAKTVIFLERVHPFWFGAAKKYFLVPNQERFPKRQVGALKKISTVLCKTHHAEEIFGKLGCQTFFTGFTSSNRKENASPKDFKRFFHLAGRSTEKGTAALISIWARNPSWPTLTIVIHPKNAEELKRKFETMPPHVELATRRLSEEELRSLQNECGIHLCPSRCEGWGHYIVEAMSVGAVVVTTDAPPMNEIIGDDRGILVAYAKESPRHLGVAYDVDPIALEAALNRLLNTPEATKAALGANARAWFEMNHDGFIARVKEWAEREMKE